MVAAAGLRLGIFGRTAIILGGVLPAIALGTMPVMLPGISDAFSNGANGLLVKMVSTAAGFGMMFGAPLGGLLAQRVGRLPPLALSALLFGLFGCGATFATGLEQLIVARFVVGVASGATAAGFVALIGDAFAGHDRDRWLSYNGVAATLLSIAFNLLAGALADTGWRHGFLVYAAAFPMLALVLLGIPTGSGGRAPAAPAGDDAAAASRARLPWRPLAFAMIVGTISTGTALYWPFRLRDLGVRSAGDLSFYAVPNVVMITVGAFAFSHLRRRFSVPAMFALCGVLSATGLALIAVGDRPLVACGLLVEGLAVGLLNPNLSLYAISAAQPGRSARMVGMIQGALFGSPFVTQFALEPIDDAGGPSAALLGVAALSTGLVVAALWQVRRGRTTWREPPPTVSM